MPIDNGVRWGPADFIDNRVETGWILEGDVTLQDWMSIDVGLPDGDSSLRRDFGPMLRKLVRTTAPANSACRLWGAELEDPQWRIYGMVQDVGRDAHVTVAGTMDRSERVRRQNLTAAGGEGPVSWAEVDALTSALDRKRIVSSRFEIDFVWTDAAGLSRMDLTFPVRFKAR